MLEENEVDCRLMDSELRDLKEEITRLASLVSQIEMPKSHLSESNKSHVSAFIGNIRLITFLS